MSSRIAKVIVFAAAACGLVAAAGVQDGRAATSGLVAAYAFNEGSGATVTDSSGNSNTGTISGAAWTGQGKYGGALVFNGSSARVNVPNSTSLQLSSGMTLEAWVDPASVSSAWRDVIYKGNDNYYLEGTSDHGGAPAGGGTLGGVNVNAFGVSALLANTWSYVSLTYDGAALRFYVNGTLVASQAKTGAITSSTNQLQIGGDSLYGQFFEGLIDEVRIYNTALTATQIQTDMTTPIGGGSDTQPPSTPTGLATSGVGQTSLMLSWNASSDNVGVMGYRLYLGDSQVGTSLTTSYLFSGLTCATGYTLGVAAVDAAGNVSGIATVAQSSGACSDTQPPSAPGKLSASAASSSEVDLSWGAATDNLGVTGYQVFRCQGAGCTSFAQVGTATGTSFPDTGLAAATSYSYQVRALDAAGNQGPFSNSASATTKAAASGLVAAYSFDAGSGSTVADSSGNGNTGTISGAAWTGQGKYGGALVFNGSSARVNVPNSTSLQLSSGMTLEAWVDPTSVSSAWRDVIYKGNDNYYLMGTTDHAGVPAGAVTAAGSSAHAYGTGMLATNSWSFLAATYDGTTLRLYVNGTLAASQAASGAITSSTNQLQIGGDSIYGQYFNGLIDQVRIYNTALSATQIQTDMNTPISGGSTDTQPPSTPTGLAVSSAGQTTLALSWSAASDNVGVTSYGVYNNGILVGSPATTSYALTGLACGTSYTVAVDAVDAAGNRSARATITTSTNACPDTTPPTAPTGLAVSSAGQTTLALSWSAASDNVGVTGYQVFRCQGAGCTSFAQVGTATGTSFPDTGLAAATSYSYQVRALDAAGNQGPFSNSASATTKAAASGLVAAYSFDAGSGSTVADSSGNGNTGTISGAAWTGQGKYGGALVFNGSSARVNVPNSTSLQLSSGMTLEAWVDPTSVSSAWRDVIYKGNDNYYLMGTTDHAGVPAGAVTAAGSSAHAYGTGMLATNSWSFLAATYDGTTLRLYVNGTLAASQAASGAITSSTNQLQIGGDSIYGQYFNGLIDQVRIYNTALSATQIQTDMTTPISGGSTDTQPPSTPTGLAASGITQTSVTLSWNSSSDNVGVIGYRLFRNGTQVGSPSATTYSDSPLTASTTYSYTVEAVDAAGNVSIPSAALGVTTAPAPAGPGPIRVGPTGRYLVDQNNAPWLMVGDSPQAMINISEADMATYMADRQAQGFNTIWVNLLCAEYTFCPANGTTYDGIKPFTSGTSPGSYDLSTPNTAYFTRIDDLVALAASKGLVVMLDPIETGPFGCGSDCWVNTLENNGATKDFNYGAFLGSRYKNYPNIIWMSGNDFNTWGSADGNLVFQVMQGIHSTDPNHIQTIEGPEPQSSSLDNQTFTSRVDLNAAYTYSPNYDEVLHAYNQSATVPTFMVESNYEGENNTGHDPSTPQVLRRQEYWTMTSGATGQLYGNHYTTGFFSGWQSNLDTPGTTQLNYLTQLLSTLPWWKFVPDQTHSVITAGYGTYDAAGFISTNDYATAARASDGSAILIYLPTVRTITVDMSKITGSSVTARWFDPTNNTYSTVAGSPFANSGSRQFTPPGNNAEGSTDWVLELQAA